MANPHKTELSRLTQLTGNPQAAIDVINGNSALIENAIDDAISRSGKIPNQMTAAFDMNSNRIINLGEPKEDYDAVRYKDVSDLLDTTKAVQVEMEGLAATTTLKAQEASESASSAAASAVAASDVLTNPAFVTVSEDLLLGANGNIGKVNANKTNIDTVAGISEDVTAAAAVATDISTVVDMASDISAVVDIASDISTNATNAAAISTNAEHISDISATAAISSDISTAAGIASDISTNATNAAAISTNAEHITDISTAAGIASDISTNATNATAISTNATHISDISAVAGIASDVSTNASNATAISTNAANITDIQNASANAAAAAASAVQASTYAVGDPAEPATGHSAKWYSEHMGLVFKGTYNASTTYDNNDFVSDGDANSPAFYISVADNNVGNPLSDTTHWAYLWTVSSSTVAFSNITGQPTDNTNLATALSGKQNTLVSGTDIKTINTTSLLGSGDISLQTPLVSGTSIKTVNSNSLLGSGDVAVQETLVSGTNIKTINNTSLLGSGDITISGGADTDLSNISATGKTNIAYFGSPSDTVIDIRTSSDFYYTAPANGFITGYSASATMFIDIYAEGDTSHSVVLFSSGTPPNWASQTIAIRKGQIARVRTSNTSFFIYAQGEI